MTSVRDKYDECMMNAEIAEETFSATIFIHSLHEEAEGEGVKSSFS